MNTLPGDNQQLITEQTRLMLFNQGCHVKTTQQIQAEPALTQKCGVLPIIGKVPKPTMDGKNYPSVFTASIQEPTDSFGLLQQIIVCCVFNIRNSSRPFAKRSLPLLIISQTSTPGIKCLSEVFLTSHYCSTDRHITISRTLPESYTTDT